jgi:hypothetical protein
MRAGCAFPRRRAMTTTGHLASSARWANFPHLDAGNPAANAYRVVRQPQHGLQTLHLLSHLQEGRGLVAHDSHSRNR